MPYFRDINIYGCDGPYIITSGTTTIDLAGHGNTCSPLQAFLRISELVGNAITILPDGIYVPESGSGATTAIVLSGDAAGSGSTLVPVTVTGIQGHAVASPSTAGLLKWNGAAWIYDNTPYITGVTAINLIGDVLGTGPSSGVTTTIGAGKVTNTMLAGGITASKILTSGITSVGTITSGTWQGTPIADAYIASAATWNAKQNAITLGTTAQYFRGDLSLATFPTLLSQFTNDVGYITGTTALTLLGDVTGTGPLSGVTTTIGAGKVTNTMLAGGITASKILTSGITSVGTITGGTWQGTPIADAYIASAAYWNSLQGPSGITGSVQYKNGAFFAGSTGFTFDSGTGTLTNAGVVNVSGDTAALIASNTAGTIQSQLAYNALSVSTGSNTFNFSNTGISSLVGGQSLTYNGNLTLQSLSSTGTTFVQATSGGTLTKHILNSTDITTALGYTPSGGISIGNTVSGGTQGSVLFLGVANVLAQDNSNFFWDDTNNRLGIRTSSPTSALTIKGDANLVPTSGVTSSYAIFSDNIANSRLTVRHLSGSTESVINVKAANGSTTAEIFEDGGAIFTGNISTLSNLTVFQGYTGSVTNLTSGTTAIDGSVQVYICDTSAGNVTLTVTPSALGQNFFKIKKKGTDTNSVIISMTAGSIYADAGAQSSFTLSNPGEAIDLVIYPADSAAYVL